jgi:DNA-binding NtrC family response regulator
MGRALSVLILEDVSTDAELEMFELLEAGICFTASHATDRISFVQALDKSVPDIILSDYSLPTFDGSLALEIARKRCPDVPFIIVSGEIGEELAAELIKKGAKDFVQKSGLSRLGPVVLGALKEAERHRKRLSASKILKN